MKSLPITWLAPGSDSVSQSVLGLSSAWLWALASLSTYFSQAF